MSANKETKKTLGEFIKYIFVGGGATIVQWGVLIVLKELFKIDANLANFIGFCCGLAFNYIISTIWVFDKNEAKVDNKLIELSIFSVIGIVGLGINQFFIWLFDKALANREVFFGIIPTDKNYLIGQVIATGVAFFWNFFARKYILYNKKGTGVHEKE